MKYIHPIDKRDLSPSFWSERRKNLALSMSVLVTLMWLKIGHVLAMGPPALRVVIVNHGLATHPHLVTVGKS